MAIFFLFIDGVGIGGASELNPFSKRDFKIYQEITGRERMVTNEDPDEGLDACLGIEGLPQSGTGQVTLFTGVNVSKLIGQHFGPYPHSGTKNILTTQSLFHQVQEKGRSPLFLNAYPERFFQYSEAKNRWSATTLMAKNAETRLHTVEDVRNGIAITAEILQDVWKSVLYSDVQPITAEQAAGRVLKAGLLHDVVLTEFYLTDKAGHERDLEKANEVISRFDDFATEILNGLGDDDTLIITSDHGNVEDLSTKTHTFNRVPWLVAGKGRHAATSCKDLTDVTPFICSLL